MGNPYRDIRPADYRERAKRYRTTVPPDLLASASELQARRTPRRPLSTGLDEYTGTFGEAEAVHLLKRTLFGVKKSELKSFSSMTLEQAVDALVTESPTPAPPVNDYNELNAIPDPDVPEGEPWVEAPFNDELEGGRVISTKSWIVKNMLNQEATLHEKMTFFWHNLLAIQFFDVFVGKGVYQYYEMLRRDAFGNYKTLVRDLTLDPAMLLFLNGTFNNKEQPDENFARELQELFTVGKGAGSQYTEQDIGAAARVLTGWVINFSQAESEGPVGSFFWPDGHETSDKQFSAFYGNKVIEGKDGFSGADELDELLTMIFDTQEAAKYICRRLYNFFVYPEIDEVTETQVIEPLAAIFRDANYEIKPVLKTLFKSEHFFDAANQGAMIKSPADFMLGLWRTLEHSNPHADDVILDAQYYLNPIWTMSGQGQEIGDPPS
ncbi:MAG TPA: hypothetical protein DCE41_32545, partial [Cytophagales bacterium]|nr:hypothetical protein [Cytophagales bacterium]